MPEIRFDDIPVTEQELVDLRSEAPIDTNETEPRLKYVRFLEKELIRTRKLVRDCYAHSTLAGEDGALSDEIRTKMDDWGMHSGRDDE